MVDNQSIIKWTAINNIGKKTKNESQSTHMRIHFMKIELCLLIYRATGYCSLMTESEVLVSNCLLLCLSCFAGGGGDRTVVALLRLRSGDVHTRRLPWGSGILAELLLAFPDGQSDGRPAGLQSRRVVFQFLQRLPLLG